MALPGWLDQGPPPQVDLNYAQGIEDPYTWGHSMVLRWSEHLDPSDGVMVDISPASVGNVDPALFSLEFEAYDQFYNWEQGGDPGLGWDFNPQTGLPYEPQIVPRGDYARVLAEFWADGPDSETPPGHWYTILNEVMDHPDFESRWMGEGEAWDTMDWEVCAYFTLGGAMHDAAIAAWSHKGWYDYIRPVSALRWMQGRGQCTDPDLPNFDVTGLPLIEGFCELVTADDSVFVNPLTSKNSRCVHGKDPITSTIRIWTKVSIGFGRSVVALPTSILRHATVCRVCERHSTFSRSRRGAHRHHWR